jgi:hypothetical protein
MKLLIFLIRLAIPINLTQINYLENCIKEFNFFVDLINQLAIILFIYSFKTFKSSN